ncbi:MAG: hypothetical protein K6T65_02290 [Peptococcaceae bacterium]|nr:hypothetical protein [Peptococcaceae bacterium]
MHQYRVPKTTQTYADTLVAVGIADLFATWPGNDFLSREVRIEDRGDAYTLTVNPPIDTSNVRGIKLSPGYPYVKFKGKDKAPAGINEIDYEAEKEKGDRYRDFDKLVKKARRNRKGSVLLPEEKPEEPDENLQLLKDFNNLRMGSNSYNDLLLALLDRENLVEIVLRKLAKQNDIDFDKGLSASNLQLFSPISGKGVHRPKPDGVGLGGLSDRIVDWFDEWMKYRAMYIVMSSYRVGEDTKVLVISPGDINLMALCMIRKEFLKTPLWGSLRLEIIAVLSLARILILKSDVYSGREVLKLRNRRPNQVIKGVNSVLFKSLGTGKAVMNVSFLGLPGWFPITNSEDAIAWLEIIGEHEKCITTLNEDRSGDITLLQGYRNFISTGNLTDFLDFTAEYGSFIMQRLAQNEWVEQFSIPNLRRLFMSYSLKEIVENEGFLSIARAIRRATVNAQYRKAKGSQVFEIHYGLAQEWKRKVKYPEQFVMVLSEFVQEYNAENARHAEQIAKNPERIKERRESISINDLNEVISLTERFNSELVGMLLLAYGYAKEENKGKEEE